MYLGGLMFARANEGSKTTAVRWTDDLKKMVVDGCGRPKAWMVSTL